MTPASFVHTCSDSNSAVMKFCSVGKLAVFNGISMLLILVLLLLPIVSASDNISLVPDDPLGIIGESLQMWCSILSTSGLKSSDLHLELTTRKRHLPVDSHFIRIVNETTVEMNYPDLPMMLNNAVVTCRLKSSTVNQTDATKNELHVEQFLQVGYRPFKPYIEKDYKVYNWEHFTFSWNINETDPVYLTTYKAWYRPTTALDFTCCSGGQKAKQQGNTCRIAKVLDLVHPNGYLLFKVNGSNAVGLITSDTEKPNLYHLIQPGKVKNVTVSSSVSNGVVAEFYSPNNEHNLKYRISVACGNTTWPAIQIKNFTGRNSKGPVRWKIEHVLPPFAKCHISVACLPFHNRQYWSDWSENVSFTSPDGLPLVGPQLCCFEIIAKHLRQRQIQIYYKNLTEREAQGEIVAYHVHLNILTSGSQMNFTGAKEKHIDANRLFFSLDVDTETSFTLSVSPQTRAGRSPTAISFMPVLIQDEILPLPENITAIWHGSGIVTVSWLPLEEKSIGYTVVWCKGHSQCEKPVDWAITSTSTYNIQLPSEESHLSYLFGIVVSRVGGGSSGIRWIDCIYNISAGASAPSVLLLNKTRSAVSFHFSEPKCGLNNGYIYEYQVYYMKDGENVSSSETSHRLKIAKWNIVIDHLEPDSNYSFNVVALTHSGPSEKIVINVMTDQSNKLTDVEKGLLWLVVPAVLVIAFIFYSCYRWNMKQLLKFKKWLNMEITIPKQQTLENREPADGGQLSSSYTSLTKNQEPLLLVHNTQHSEQMTNSSDFKDEKEEVLTAAKGVSPEVQDMRPVTEGDSVHLPHAVKNLSGPDGITCCGIDHNTLSAEQSQPINRRLLASTTETQSEQMNGRDVFISQNTMHTVGGAATSLSSHHLDESDEVEDYSNVRITDPSEHIESSPDIIDDGYSLGRLPASELTEEDSDIDYSTARLLADVDYQLVRTEAQPVLQSPMDNSLNHDDSAEDEEGDQDSDNYYSVNYSRASNITRLQ